MILAAAMGLWAGAGAQALAEPTPVFSPLPSSLPAPVEGAVGETPLAGSAEPGAGTADPVTGTVTTVTGTVTRLLVASGDPAAGDPAPDGQSHEGHETGEDAESGATAPSSGPAAPAASASEDERAAEGGRSASARVQTPVVSACIIPTGSTSPAVGLDLEVLGADLGTPLAEGIPQVFTPCPEGTVPPGDRLVAADADVEGLLGACVRITREVVPAQTTVVVLDRNLIEELVTAGLPLEQLVEPCPSALAAGLPGAGGPGAPGADGGDRSGNAVPGLPDRLPFTGSSPGPLLAVATGLLSVGAILVRRAQLLAARA